MNREYCSQELQRAERSTRQRPVARARDGGVAGAVAVCEPAIGPAQEDDSPFLSQPHARVRVRSRARVRLTIGQLMQCEMLFCICICKGIYDILMN